MLKINLKGLIISNSDKFAYDYFGYEATCPNDISYALENATGDIELDVNSNGGLVDMGSEIYTTLRSYDRGKITANIVGMAASAASVAIMGADERLISPTGRIMIHNAQSRAAGDHVVMKNASAMLQSANQSIKNAYMGVTGLSDEELTELMQKETYMSAEEAIKLGFADRLMFEEYQQLVASDVALLPTKVIAKLRSDIKNQEQEMLPIQEQERKNKIEAAINEIRKERILRCLR